MATPYHISTALIASMDLITFSKVVTKKLLVEEAELNENFFVDFFLCEKLIHLETVET